MKLIRFVLSGTAVLLFLLSVSVAQQRPAPTGTPVPAERPGATPQPSPTRTPAPTPVPAGQKMTFSTALSQLRFREIGPAVMGGRIDDIEVDPTDSRVVYVATAAGGILKSTNGGTSWNFIFDKESVPSVGDIAITPTNPSIIWAGTGEANNRQSSSWGNGIYKSLDAGKTWKRMGLENTMHIARIVIHPRDPNVVYVAATGNLWGSSPDRGVYRTMDGGKTWQLVLKVNDDTGATDIAIDNESPTILYAAMYQRRRTVFGFNGSGEGSALYKTNDGGDTWTKITKGMPYDTESAPNPRPDNLLETGRNAIAIYPRDTNIVYALVEHANGGIYRSNDKGETWTRMANIDQNPRPMYFSQIRIDPNNDQRLWMAGVTMQFSEDGGRTWTQNNSRAPHADTHAIWIDPANSDHLIMGNDGGINITYDRGRTWDYANTVAIGQFYEVGVDNGYPYKICGGLQDNNAWCGPSRSSNPQGISNDDWYAIGGGDGFYAQPDPNDTAIVYTESQDGNVLRRNTVTGEAKSIRPREEEGEKLYRFQWNSPILISQFDSNTIYYGGNFLFKSPDRGDSWTKVGNVDLTTNMDRNNLPIMGKVPDKNTRSRHDGVQQFPAITTISESPVNKNVLWVGTDDGNVQVTRDGQSWTNVIDKIPGVPKNTYVSRVVASRAGEGSAFVTFDGHRSGDFKVYVFATNDFGQTWRSISNDLPQNTGVVSVIREHPHNQNLLFVGTEFGLFASNDRGAHWLQIKQNLPTVPVDDILIHPRENDLILGTHGRSIWILDDIEPMVQMTQATLDSKLEVFKPRDTILWRTWSNRNITSDKLFYGPNPPNGAMINFYLKDNLADKENVTITIQNSAGQTVRTVTCNRPNPQAAQQQTGQFQPPPPCTASAGVNRYVWDLRNRLSNQPPQPGEGGGFGGGIANLGFRVDPGDYTVKVKLGAQEISRNFRVVEDPRITFTDADRGKKRDALSKVGPLILQANTAQTSIVQLRTNVNNAIESWKRPGAPAVPDNVKKAADDLLKRIDAAYVNWGTPPSLTSNISQAGPPLVELPTPLNQRIGQIASAIENTSAAPTTYEMRQIEVLSKRIPTAAQEVQQLVSELNSLNQLMLDAKLPYIQPPTARAPQPQVPPSNDRDDDDDPDR